jgi:tRNA dimethylallyltransferase
MPQKRRLAVKMAPVAMGQNRTPDQPSHPFSAQLDCKMFAAGALDEAARLAARKLDPSLPAMKAHGVPWLIRHLQGEITLAEAAAGGKRDTRRYTKRQATWFRHQLPDWMWVAPADAEAVIHALTRAG